MRRRGSGDHSRQHQAGESGATTVEFAFAMIWVFFFFTAYYQIVEIFIAHERVSYAAFLASRAHQVHGDASTAAGFVESGYELTTRNDSVTVSKDIRVPLDFENPFSGNAFRVGGAWFTVAETVPTFSEPGEGSGDN